MEESLVLDFYLGHVVGVLLAGNLILVLHLSLEHSVKVLFEGLFLGLQFGFVCGS